MEMVAIIGVDLAKRSFQVHGAAADGSVLFRKKLSRAQVLAFFVQQPNCTVAMEACATAHDWGRQIEALGHDVKLIPPIYVKPFVKRHKNDAADAEAVAEAVIQGLDAESFLILPHPEVEEYRQNKARSYERWLGGMRKLRRLFTDPVGK